MCASYGMTGGLEGLGLTFDLPPMHEPDSRALVAQWAREQAGRARITGRRARNLNPIVHEGRGARGVELAWWWLHVGGAPAPFSAFNSRDDALLRSWREPFQRRALLPADWYVEKGRVFGLPGGETFGIAAIVTPVAAAPSAAPSGAAAPAGLGARAPGAPPLSYSMVTRDAVAEAADVHPRMPLVLPRDFFDEWLDPGRVGDAELVSRARAASTEICARMRVAAGEAPSGAAAPAPAPTLF